MSVEQIGGVNFYAPESESPSKELDKDAFLQLLVAQLKFQDPLEPTENTEFVAQLAQYSSLEQLVSVNENLESGATLSQTTNNSLVASYIGKDISAVGNNLKYDGNDVKGGYNLANTGQVNVRIVDNLSNPIRTIEVGTQESGTHYFSWDGKDGEGNLVGNGDYYFEVVAADTGQALEDAVPLMRGTVDQVRFIDGGAMVVMNGVDIDPSKIFEISAIG